MSFEDVRRKLRAVESPSSELIDVPIDAIVGSVGRYNDFTREFFPRVDADEVRWSSVRQAMTGQSGVPPIELYRIGDAYFVRDGNHRVSVARQLGNRTIQAYVTPLSTRVRLRPDTSPDELILAAEQADFLERTRIDELRPEASIEVTAPGKYGQLLEHIRDHRWFMGLEQGREIGKDEAVTHWYDTVYLPAVNAIQQHGLMRGFDRRTVTDLYLWLGEHRGQLWRDLGFSLPPETVAAGLSRGPALTPSERHRLLSGEGKLLVGDVLVGIEGGPSDRHAFSLALEIARIDGARLYVLTPVDRGELADEASEAGVEAQFVTTTGRLTEELLDRAAFSDIGVMGNTPGAQGLMRRCPRPLLVAGAAAGVPANVLVAFDGLRRSEDALFLGAWLHLQRGCELSVVTVAGSAAAGERILGRARAYLEQYGATAAFLMGSGPVAQQIVSLAGEAGADTILMGSYKHSAWVESVLGGVPGDVLRLWQGNVMFT